jgi:hypothetical protein
LVNGHLYLLPSGSITITTGRKMHPKRVESSAPRLLLSITSWLLVLMGLAGQVQRVTSFLRSGYAFSPVSTKALKKAMPTLVPLEKPNFVLTELVERGFFHV